MQVSFVTVDVFTDRPFGGNPLAVILDARGLSDQQMQAIAREFNYSEQTFVLPPEESPSYDLGGFPAMREPLPAPPFMVGRGGQRRGMDRRSLGRDGPCLSGIAPRLSSDLNGYQGSGPA